MSPVFAYVIFPFASTVTLGALPVITVLSTLLTNFLNPNAFTFVSSISHIPSWLSVPSLPEDTI